jgi:hypothetical protein
VLDAGCGCPPLLPLPLCSTLLRMSARRFPTRFAQAYSNGRNRKCVRLNLGTTYTENEIPGTTCAHKCCFLKQPSTRATLDGLAYAENTQSPLGCQLATLLSHKCESEREAHVHVLLSKATDPTCDPLGIMLSQATPNGPVAASLTRTNPRRRHTARVSQAGDKSLAW